MAVFHVCRWKQVLTHVGVGMGAASFWRGAWYVLDDQLFPENPNLSALSSLLLGTTGMAASQGMVARALAVQTRYLKPVARFGALYTIAMSCVLVWRGTWVGWDCVYEHLLNDTKTTVLVGQNQKQEATTAFADNTSSLMATSSSFLEHSPAHAVIKSTDPGHLTSSGLVSHIFAIAALGACGVFASVLAPPAAVSVIKDLAIKVSRPVAVNTSRGPIFQRSSTKQALEYVPHMARYLNKTSSRAQSTAARGFQSATTKAKPF